MRTLGLFSGSCKADWTNQTRPLWAPAGTLNQRRLIAETAFPLPIYLNLANPVSFALSPSLNLFKNFADNDILFFQQMALNATPATRSRIHDARTHSRDPTLAWKQSTARKTYKPDR